MLGWSSAYFAVSFVLPFHRLIMRTSSRFSRPVDLRIEGRPVEESKSGRTGGGFKSLATVVAGVLPIGYLPSLRKDKGNISEIRYPCGSEYLRATVSTRTLWALAGSSLCMLKSSLLIMDLLLVSESGVLIFSHLMWCLFPRWSVSLRWPLRTTSTSLCTPSSKAFYNISMSARPNSLLIFRASWLVFWLFSGIRASGSLV